jgi:hypothetical protein
MACVSRLAISTERFIPNGMKTQARYGIRYRAIYSYCNETASALRYWLPVLTEYGEACAISEEKKIIPYQKKSKFRQHTLKPQGSPLFRCSFANIFVSSQLKIFLNR